VILFRLLSWPYVRKHVMRTSLTTLGIVLGVAVFVGMRSANQSVLSGFSQTVDRIAGKTDLQVTAGEAGFGEDVLEVVQADRTVRVAVPVIEAVVDSKLPGGGTLLVVAIDMTGDRSLRDYDIDSDQLIDDPLVFLAQPDSVILATEFAQRHHLTPGATVRLDTIDGEKTFTVRGIMKPSGFASAFGGNLAIMDVYAAQKMFGRGRTFDRIDLAVRPGTDVDTVARGLKRALGPGFEVQPPASRGQQAESMLAGYTTMIQITSAFALFIGMFIIYSAFTTAVTQRRSEIGILRALGASRAQIWWLFVGESAVLGVIGSALGLLAGVIIAYFISALISSLIGSLYGVAEQATELATDPTLLVMSMLVGVGTSMAAAAIPAAQAARLDPLQSLKKAGRDRFSAEESRARLILGLAFALLPGIALTWATNRWIFYLAYAFMIAGAVLLGPLLIVGLMKALRPLLCWLRPVEGALAADSLIAAPRRGSAAVAALMLSVALIVAFAGIARSSYGSIADWIDTALNSDLFVMPSAKLDNRTMRFPAVMGEEIASTPDVKRVQRFRNARITFRDRPAMVVAIEMASVAETATRRPVAGDRDAMYRQAAAGEGLIVSDSLAQRHGIALGDTLEIPAPYGTLGLPVVGVVVDYTDQQGSILIDRRVFIDHWHDDSVSDFRVFVAQGADATVVRQRIADMYAGKRQVFVLTNEESRRYVLQVASQWFGIMNVQIVVAVLVAILGIFNSLTVSISDRRRELGVLRAIGALHAQIRGTVYLEAVSMAIVGVILGAALGSVNLWCMLQIVRRDVAGLRLDYHFPFSNLMVLVPIMLGTAFLASLWPARSAVRGNLVEALEYE
jgi:putative ABC transport system permease protein